MILHEFHHKFYFILVDTRRRFNVVRFLVSTGILASGHDRVLMKSLAPQILPVFQINLKNAVVFKLTDQLDDNKHLNQGLLTIKC